MDVAKMDEKTVKVIFYIILALIALYFIFKFGDTILDGFNRIFEGLGLKDSKEDKETDEIRQDAESESSPWNAKYWLNINPPPSYWLRTYVGVGVPGADIGGIRLAPISTPNMDNIYREVKNTIGFWVNNVEKLLGILKQSFGSKASWSYFAWWLLKYQNKDLMEFLHEDKPFEVGVTSETIVKINDWVKGLKKY